jgi:hypothetical protein
MVLKVEIVLTSYVCRHQISWFAVTVKESAFLTQMRAQSKDVRQSATN